MASKKISGLPTVTPLSTDLLPLDRPTIGPSAPVTGKATLQEVQNFNGGGGIKYWLESTDNFTVQNRFQYIVQGAIIIDLGGTLTIEPTGMTVILP